MEPNECKASVLGALMGFDEPQSQHHPPRHSRVLSEGYLRRVASIGLPEKKSPGKPHSFGMAIEDPKEFNSTLEVEDSLKRDRHKLRDRKNTDFALSAANRPVTRQNFVNEKHFLTDKMTHTSREFQDLLEVTDSMDISPRHTREENCILNRVEREPSASPHTQFQHKTFLKSSYTLKEVNNNAGTKFKDMEHGQAHSSGDLDILKSSSPFLEWRDGLCLSSFSPTSMKGSYLVSKNGKKICSSQNEEHIGEERGRKTAAFAMEPVRPPPQVSRFLDGSRVKKKHGLVNSIMKVPRSASMCNEMRRKATEFTRPSSPSVSTWKAESRHSCFFSVESYQAIESRKKIIKEQKMNENFEQRLSRQGRKTSQMPLLPHHVTLPNDLNCKPFKCDIKKHVCSSKEHLHSGSPLCLSHKDGRLEQLSKNSQRFKFLSATVTARSRSRSRYESLRDTWFLKPEAPANWLQRKPLDRNCNTKDASEPALRLSSKKLRVFPCPDSASDHIVNDTCMVVDDLQNRVEKKSRFDQCYFSSLSSRCSVTLSEQNNPVIQEKQAMKCSLKNKHWDDNFSIAASNSNVMAVKTDVVEFKKKEHDVVSFILLETNDDSSTYSSPTSCTSIQQEGPGFGHCSSKELNSIVSFEEAYQPSPVSVLEPLFKEEVLSSSESSKKPGINSRDLMMQLELLMSESSGTSSEGPEMIVSSDDDGKEGSIRSSEENEDIMSTFKFKNSRDFSYIVDVLTEAGLHCVTPHSQERHIISPLVFETLEKKFGEQNSWRKSERKLLFDRINSGLIELFRSSVGVPQWAKPVSRRFRPLLSREMIEEELWILLDRQEREVTKDLVNKQFGKEIGWTDLGDEIDSVCREVERLLIEELVSEFGIM